MKLQIAFALFAASMTVVTAAPYDYEVEYVLR